MRLDGIQKEEKTDRENAPKRFWGLRKQWQNSGANIWKKKNRKGNKMNLYEIDREILACIDYETGEILDSQRLEMLEMEKEKKIENIGLWIKNLEAEAEALKKEKDAFAAREKSAKNKADQLKKYLESALCGQKFQTTKLSISFRTSTTLEMSENAEVPEQFRKYSFVLDKTKMKESIKNGANYKGFWLQKKQNISIK